MTRLTFAKATHPPQMAVPRLWVLPVIVAATNAAMALAQLASFEEFVLVIDSYGLASGGGATALALAIAALEVLSLPVLLRFRLSPAMRMISVLAVVLVPLMWLQLTAWAAVYGLQLANAGFFGDFVTVPAGWWLLVGEAIYLSVSLYALKVLGGDALLSR